MSFERTREELLQTISSLESRITKLESIIFNKSEAASHELQHPVREFTTEKKKIGLWPDDFWTYCEAQVPDPSESQTFSKSNLHMVEALDLENFSGASQLGWLGIIISIVCGLFFVHFAFLKNWVTGFGQPAVLVLLGLGFFAVGDRIRRKSYFKFGAFLILLSSTLLFMAVYWASLKTPIVSSRPKFLIWASMGLWLGHLLWGAIRKTELWPMLGVAGACFLPVFVIQDFYGTQWLVLYYLIVLMVSSLFALMKNWSSLGFVATFMTCVFLLVFLRDGNLNPETQSMNSIFIMAFTFPTILILWSGFVPFVHDRATTAVEKFTGGVNNVLFYLCAIVFWQELNAPWLLLVPLAVNAILFFSCLYKNKKQAHEFLYLLGTVITTAIALTVLMPIPFDIISLCLFAGLLGHKANQEDGWHLKLVSGAMIVWCLIFLFSMRFSFSAPEELPFLNLRFASFVIAFVCFGYQGRMINNDVEAKEMGPILGQGLFSLGLAVLLLGMGGEVVNLFPAGDEKQISQLALLFLTVLGGVFAFAVTYVGVVLKLFFIRILAIIFFVLLVAKLLFLDLFILDTSYLVVSLGSVGFLLGSTSVLLKRKATVPASKS